MNKLGFVCAIALLLAGCGPSSSKLSKDDYNPENITYYQDKRTKICFAVIAYSRVDSGGKISGGITHTSVQCTPEVLNLIN